MNTVISDSELMTGIHYSCAIPGLIQYLQSITHLVIAKLSVSVDPDISSSSSPVTEKRMNPSLLVIRLLQSDFHEVRLLMLQTLLLWWKQVNSKQVTGENRCPFSSLLDLEETLLKMTMMESHPQCFCKVGRSIHLYRDCISTSF